MDIKTIIETLSLANSGVKKPIELGKNYAKAVAANDINTGFPSNPLSAIDMQNMGKAQQSGAINAVPMASGDLPTMTQQQPVQPQAFTQAPEKNHPLDVTPVAQPAQNDWLGGIVKAIPGIAKGFTEFAGKPEGFKTFAALTGDPYMKEALLNRGNKMEERQIEEQQLQKKFAMEKELKKAEAGMKPEFSTYGTQPVMIGGQYFIPQVGKKLDQAGNPEIRMVPLPQGSEYATTEQAPENLELKGGAQVVGTYDKAKDGYNVSQGEGKPSVFIPLSQVKAKGLSANTIINLPKEPTGKRIPAGTAMDIADLKSSVDLLNNFDTQIDSITDKGLFNPFTAVPRTATIGGVNVADATNDTEARKYVSAITLLKQIVAKGLEGGVLRQEDTKKYDKILGSAGASKAALKDISKEIRTMIRVKEKNTLNVLESSGYDVGNISRIGADNGQQLTQEQQALQWIAENPNDPRVPAMKKKLGVK